MVEIVTIQDVKSRWSGGQVPPDTRIEIALADALDILASKGGTPAIIAQRIASGALTTQTLKRVVSEATTRLLTKPRTTHLQSWSESIGGAYSQSQTLNASGVAEMAEAFTREDLIAILGEGSTLR